MFIDYDEEPEILSEKELEKRENELLTQLDIDRDE